MTTHIVSQSDLRFRKFQVAQIRDAARTELNQQYYAILGLKSPVLKSSIPPALTQETALSADLHHASVPAEVRVRIVGPLGI